MQDKNRDQTVEIDLLKLLGAYLRRWWLIALCGVIVAAGAYIYTAKFITPLYRAGVTIYVNNSSSGERVDSVTSGNLSVSQQLVNTYVNIIKSDTVLDKVIESAHLNCTTGQLRAMMSTEQMTKTEMFKVYISNPDPEQAAYIANAMAEIAPAQIGEFVEGSSTKIIDYAKVPNSRFSPSYRKNTMIGGVIGVAIALIYLTLYYLLDVRIKEEADLTSITDYPVLGQIPEFSQLSSRSGKYGYGYGKKSDKSDAKPRADKQEGGKT